MAVDVPWETLIAGLQSSKIAVGFQRGDNHSSGAGMAEIAIYNEYGTSQNPARPFFRPTLHAHNPQIITAIRNVAVRQLQGGGNVDAEMMQVGTFAVNKIRAAIVSLRSPPNAASTIAMKGSSNPLIDTGQMRQSVRAKHVP